MASTENPILRAILATIARQTFPPGALYKLVVPKAGAEQNVEAYNLCDGTRTVADIAKELKIDAANLRKRILRWAEEGVIVKVEQDKATYPVHLYPLTASAQKEAGNV